MITWHDLYTVLAALVPLYVAMILAYGSVRWWKIFSPDQCSGINRFVAVFAVPLLSFHFISTNNPYEMNFRFIAADTLQKIIILLVLGMWTTLARNGSLEWMITIFSLSTQPNTLVMGIPLLIAMYGPYSGSLMVQIVVLQCIIWYTLLLFLFEYRGAKILIVEQFPGTAASIVSFKVDSDVVSLDGRGFLETEAQVGGDGKLHVTVRKSNASRRSIGSIAAGMTPRPSNLTGAEIYSMSSSRNPTPRGSNFNNADFYSMMGYQSGFVQGRRSSFGAMDMYSVQSSLGPTPRPSNFEETGSSVPMAPQQATKSPSFGVYAAAAANAYPAPNPEFVRGGTDSNNDSKERRDYENNDNNNNNGNGEGKESQHPLSESNKNKIKVINNNNSHDAKELHMFVWSSSASPASEVDGLHVFGSGEFDTPAAPSGRSDHGAKEIRMWVSDHPNQNGEPKVLIPGSTEDYGREEYFSFVGGRGVTSGGALDEEGEMGGPNGLSKLRSSSAAELRPKADSGVAVGSETGAGKQMPPASVMTRLILIMVWRKLIRNPNTYSSLIGLIWSLVAFRWHVKMPTIIDKSISILSDAGLGMAMFSLGWMEEVGRPTCGAGPTNILAWCCGLFMALQPKIVACGNSVATFAMIIRFVTGPAIMAAASIVIGLRGDLLRIAIIQAALPQGIVPFVFAKEYNNHPAILSTAVIFGMLIALPIDLLYYVLLGL